MENNKRIIEIDGVKLEVDLRDAKVIDHYKVGDSVKLLKKNYSRYDSYPAVIIGFTDFKYRPTIELLYLDGYDIEFTTYYSPDDGQVSDLEIAPFNKYEVLFERDEILRKIDRQINEKEESLRVMKEKKKAFLDVYAKAFENEMVEK